MSNEKENDALMPKRTDRGSAYRLHEFVIMPDYIHVLLTRLTTLEKAVQFIKGGFSYSAKKEIGPNMEVWQKGFSDHSIPDANDYALHVSYIHDNPVKENFCERGEDYPYSSADPGFELDAAPQGLKPRELGEAYGAAQAASFQSVNHRAPEGVPTHCVEHGRPEAVPFQSKILIQSEPSNPTSESLLLHTKSKTA